MITGLIHQAPSLEPLQPMSSTLNPQQISTEKFNANIPTNTNFTSVGSTWKDLNIDIDNLSLSNNRNKNANSQAPTMNQLATSNPTSPINQPRSLPTFQAPVIAQQQFMGVGVPPQQNIMPGLYPTGFNQMQQTQLNQQMHFQAFK